MSGRNRLALAIRDEPGQFQPRFEYIPPVDSILHRMAGLDEARVLDSDVKTREGKRGTVELPGPVRRGLFVKEVVVDAARRIGRRHGDRKLNSLDGVP